MTKNLLVVLSPQISSQLITVISIKYLMQVPVSYRSYVISRIFEFDLKFTFERIIIGNYFKMILHNYCKHSVKRNGLLTKSPFWKISREGNFNKSVNIYYKGFKT